MEHLEEPKRKEELLKIINSDFDISRGHPWPFGSTITRDGINFSVFSSSAKAISLVIYNRCDPEPLVEFPLDPRINKTGNVWHAHISGLDPWIYYAYRVYPDDHHLADGVLVIDPYAKATCGGEIWGKPKLINKNNKLLPFRLSTIIDNNFDWEMDQPLNRHLTETIIYELHVRGFTQDESSKTKNPGTFKGLVEKIPHLLDLGVTAVELMPVNDFDELYVKRRNPINGESLKNYWGYDPISFFALKSAYASDKSSHGVITEFKEMVKALHKAGIEVILDMVFNHTAEGNEYGETYSLKALDRDTYYLFDKEKHQYLNYSGCGNTVNCNHPVVRSMIIDALRYFVMEMHVDGFRFDLASILSRGPNGEVLSDPPILERIALDPVLANTKIIAEAWDAAGLYQVGTFPHWKRWMEWNGKFRDDIRLFINDEPAMVPFLAKRISGSSDLYEDDGREPYHSVNFVSCHDGFPLADLVAYSKKHNLANGEQNRDGENHNNSYNYGVEGPTDSTEINQIRQRQIKNYIVLLLLSQGVPMFHAGDEFGRTQGGNNNAYCQDNKISWIDWTLLEKNKSLYRFFKLAIKFRKAHNHLHRRQFKVETYQGVPEMSWHGTKLGKADWTAESRTLGLYFAEKKNSDGLFDSGIYIMINGDQEINKFELPRLPNNSKWYRSIDTFKQTPQDIFEEGKEQSLQNQKIYTLENRSIAVFISK